MKMFHQLWRCAPLAAACFASWPALADAQNASLEALPLPPSLSGPTVDRGASDDGARAGTRRRDHLSVGALVGVGFPRPLAVEGIVRLERAVLLGVEYSALPQISVSDVKASSWAVAGDARFFPFRGPFFVGLRGGQQHISAETSVSAYGYTVPAALSVDTTFLNPRLGFLWTWDAGIALGIDAGVQIPLSSSASSSLPRNTSSVLAGRAASAQQSVESVARTVGQTTLPTIDLLRVGVLF